MPTETKNEMMATETPPIDAHAQVAEIAPPADVNVEVAEIERRPDLLWDHEAHGLCIRVCGDGSQSFIFVYRLEDRQRFIRIGRTPVWSLKAARKRATSLRAMVDQGQDLADYIPEPSKIEPVENVIRFIAEHLRTEPIDIDGK